MLVPVSYKLHSSNEIIFTKANKNKTLQIEWILSAFYVSWTRVLNIVKWSNKYHLELVAPNLFRHVELNKLKHQLVFFKPLQNVWRES